MRTTKLKTVPIEATRFLVDENILPLKIAQHPALSTFAKAYNCCVCLGAPGSGKTTVGISMVAGKKSSRIFRNNVDKIFVFQPQASRDSLGEQDPFSPKKVTQKNEQTGVEEESEVKQVSHLYDELTLETLTDCWTHIQAYNKERKSSLIFMDDVTASFKNTNPAFQSLLNTVVLNRRHNRTHIIFCCQQYLKLPNVVRRNCSSLILVGRVKNANEGKSIYEESLSPIVTQKQWLEAQKYIYKDNIHNFALIDLNGQRIFKNFSEELSWHDEDPDDLADSDLESEAELEKQS
jgi:hypothetical protein